jgi:D-3-phosphoglycerate dehydrogenase / 2-oxoglutarate reductase
MKKVFISTTSFAIFSNKPIDLLKSHNFKVELNQMGRKLTSQEIQSSLSECAGVIAGTETYSINTLKNLPSLKIISRLGVGLDNIDLDFAKKSKIAIYKTQTTPAPAVAELTLGLILDLFRKISYQNNLMKIRKWKKEMGLLLEGKTIGIIGLGTIGRKLVKITKGLNLKYIAYDIIQDDSFAMENGVQYVSLNDIYTQSDIITIHLNLSNETRHLIDYNALRKMKKDAVLINTSRGEIIDENALIKSLNEKNIRGAGLDVFDKEPYSGSLLNFDNVITTPHIGAYAKEIRMKMEIEAAENLVQGLINE